MTQSWTRLLILVATIELALGFAGVRSSTNSIAFAPWRMLQESPLVQRDRLSPPLRKHPLALSKLMATPSDTSEDDEEDEGNSMSITTKKEKSLLEKIDDFGQSLKPKALRLKAKRDDPESESTKKKQILLSLRVCGLFTLFILYRAYRGFFVLLPAVFQEVYAKMETSVDSPFTDDPQDINPDTGKVRWRTRITVAVLSAIVTMSYVLGGLVRIVGKFFKTVASTSSIMTSFEAAADEVEMNENKIRKMTTRKDDGKGERGLAP